MDSIDIFVSVGGTATTKQESFVVAVEERLKAEGLIPFTVGRNTFSSDAPLKTITKLMRSCSATVVIALERKYFPIGFDKPGGDKQKELKDIKLSTPWNQIEAAMAYSHGHPLLVIVEEGLSYEGLLDEGSEWYVMSLPIKNSALNSKEFNGVLADWKTKIKQRVEEKNEKKESKINPAELSLGILLKSLTAIQLWSLLIALSASLVGAFALGAKLITIAP